MLTDPLQGVEKEDWMDAAADIQSFGRSGVCEDYSRTPRGYWTVSVRLMELCTFVLVSVAVTTTA